jgi:Flp pilus assembly protein TadG
MKNRKRQSQRGISVMMTAWFLVFFMIPMVGLTIDTTMLYVDKTRLQGAVDGAALAGAQSLSRGTTDAAQQTAAAQAAETYVYLNYAPTLFLTTNVQVTPVSPYTSGDVIINETVANQRTVTVTAHATVPTLFMRYLHFTSTTFAAAATVTRRDVNVSMVVDRSGSLATSMSCGAVQQAAINFVNKFANGTDYVGLVTFASSTNADFPIASNFQTATPSVPTLIDDITCEGSTSSAMALWYGYDQLVGLNEPGALNVILFFTDGKPTGVNVAMPIASSSSCQNSNGSGVIKGLYNTYTNQDEFFGVLAPTNTGLLNITNADFNVTPDNNSGAGCAFSPNWSNNITVTSDFKGVPTHDLYGSSLDNGWLPVTYNGSYIDLGNATNADNMAQNAALDAAVHIRAGATETGPLPHVGHSLANVLIYSVGLGNAPYPLSVPLLQAISNDPGAPSPWYLTTEAPGLCVVAPTTADINAAFSTVASQILRIAK